MSASKRGEQFARRGQQNGTEVWGLGLRKAGAVFFVSNVAVC